MPWERERAATAITEDAANRAMVRMLEAITDTGYRRSIRDLLALECEFTPRRTPPPPVPRALRKAYRSAQPKSRYCRPSCWSAAHKRRKREAARESGQDTTED